MIGFLLTVLAVWGTMHLYALLRVWLYWGLPARYALMAAPAVLALMISPLAALIFERRGYETAAAVLTWPGMLWAGAFFLFFSLSLVHDGYNLVLTGAARLWSGAERFRLLGPKAVAVEAGLVALLSLYAVFEAGTIRTEQATLPTPKLPRGAEPLRVVQITDIHLSPTVGPCRLGKILRTVERAEPDLLVCTGDLLDSLMLGRRRLARMLSEVHAPLGKYAVTGNHEYYAGLDRAVEFTERGGFRLLMNESVRVREGLTLAGVEDRAARFVRGRPEPDEQAVLAGAAGGDLVLLLKHRPLVQPESLPLMDAQISGHTHRGQLFPFTLVIALYYRYAHGLVEPATGTYLYTSRGSGTWGPPMRFLNPPEVTVLDFVPAGRTMREPPP